MQTIGEERNQYMCVGTVLELMIDGPDGEFAFQTAKHALDLCELDIARPQHCWIFRDEIAAQ